MTLPNTPGLQNASLAPELEVALAHCAPEYRRALFTVLELDARLARIVAGTSEPMLGQMRLAWWRETLSQPVSGRPAGDAVLDAVAAHWQGREAALVTLVDGWEHILAEPPLSEGSARAFAEARSEALVAVYTGDLGQEASEAARIAAWHWALSDLAAKVTLEEERALLVRLGLERPAPQSRLPQSARGLAVLGALGLRALDKGGRPLMEGRGASLVAIRAAMLGR